MLPLINLDWEKLTSTIKENLETVREFPECKPNTMAFLFPVLHYVVKDDDVQVMDSLIKAFSTTASVGYFADASMAVDKLQTAAVGLFGTLLTVYRNLKKKGKTLPQRDFKILLCLKNNPDIELDYLHHLLQEKDIIIDNGELQEILTGFMSLYMNDGSKRELIIEENGRYRTSGI